MDPQAQGNGYDSPKVPLVVRAWRLDWQGADVRKVTYKASEGHVFSCRPLEEKETVSTPIYGYIASGMFLVAYKRTISIV